MPRVWAPNDDEHALPPPPTPEWRRRLSVNRRTFVKLGLGGLGGLGLATAGCAPGGGAAPPSPTARPTVQPAAPSAATDGAGMGGMGDAATPVARRGAARAAAGTPRATATTGVPAAGTPVVAAPALAAPILVVVQLSGGNDGLNTVVPYSEDAYYQNRPTLAVPATSVLPLNDKIGLHPNLSKLKQVWDGGHVALLQGVGYPTPNRSHFRSMDIWHTAEPATMENYGWLGKYLDLALKDGGNPFKAINVGPTIAKALWARETPAAAIRDITAFQLRTNPRFDADRAPLLDAFTNLTTRQASNDPFFELINKNWTATSEGARLLQSAAGGYRSSTVYPPGGLGRSLQLVASLIHANLGTRIFYTQLGGFDDHAAEKNQHDRLLTELGDGLAAFYQDLQQSGALDRVLILTFSEFGRRVRENASAGTDHGAAQPLFALGGKVKGGVYGAHPSLSALDDGDLRFDIDFRAVYSTVLTDWMGVAGRDVLGAPYDSLGFIAQ